MDLAREPDFELGALRVRPSVRQVEFDGRSETLEPRILQVLVALSRKRGEVISREELIETCWNGVVVGEDSLNRCIYRLRKLGESSGAFSLETIARVGYRLHVAGVGAATSFSRETTAESEELPDQPRASRRGVAILALTAGAVAIAVLVFLVFRPSSQMDVVQRTAFFGFSSKSGAAAATADAATDETIRGMNANRIETFARSETLGTSPDQRLIRASQLGALYALSGEVQVDGERIRIATRLEDVPTRTTLWESLVSGQASETDPLIVQTAAKATEVVSCLVRLRTSLASDERSLLPLMTKVCDELRQVNPDKIPAVRELARRAPKSAVIQASLAHAASLAFSLAPDASGPALIQEADEALARATQLDPHGLYVYMARGYVGQAKRFSLIEQKNILEEGLKISPTSGSEIFPFSMLNFQYGVHLYAVGRAREAEAYMRAATGTDPYGPFKHAQASVVLAAIGKTLEARQRFEETFARLPTAQVWEMWLMSAIFFDAGNPAQMLEAPPAFISGDAVACWREIAAVVKSPVGPNSLRGAELAARCANNGLTSSTSIVPALAALGATDQALENAKTLVPTSFLGDTAVLFWSQTRVLRADPRIIPVFERAGLLDYWRSTGNWPDFCESEPQSVCRQMMDAQPQ